MAITVNLRYTGTDGNARKFAEEMVSSGTVAKIRAENGNLRYEYYQSLDDPETILLIDQEATASNGKWWGYTTWQGASGWVTLVQITPEPGAVPLQD